ncbi:MAG: T9SS type A sorting domain-containing protein [Bacteroidota bacterium]
MINKTHHIILKVCLLVLLMPIASQILAQTGMINMRNTGTLYVLPGNNMNTGRGFENTSTAQFRNNGTVWFLGDLKNEGVIDVIPGLKATPALYRFEGTQTQQIMGNGITKLYSTLFNNPSTNAFTLSQEMYILHEANFTQGVVKAFASGGIMVFEPGSLCINTSDASYLEGMAVKNGNTAFTFPIGNSGFHRPAMISAPANNTDQFTAAYYFADPGHNGYNRSLTAYGIKNISNREFWVINRTSGFSNVMVTLTWDCTKTSAAVPADITRLRIARWDGSMWVNEGNLVTSGNPVKGTITANVTGYGVFSLCEISVKAIVDIAPNPFSNLTTISVKLPNEQRVRLGVFTMMGREIATIVDDMLSEGTHNFIFSGGNLPPGTYLCRLTVIDGNDKEVITKQLLIVR